MINGLLIFICCCIFTVIAVTLTILIYFIKKKNFKWGLIISILLLILSVISGINFMIKTVYKVKDTGSDFVEALSEHLSRRHPDSTYLDSIKHLQPKDISIPVSYFYCAGFHDYYRIPLIYPYSMITIDDLKLASIEDEAGIKNVFNESNSSKSVISNISEFWFNRDIIVAKTIELQDTILVRFAVLTFNTNQVQWLNNKEALNQYLCNHNIDTTTYQTITPKLYYLKF